MPFSGALLHRWSSSDLFFGVRRGFGVSDGCMAHKGVCGLGPASCWASEVSLRPG